MHETVETTIDVAPAQQRVRGRVPQPLDLGVDRAVLLDEGVRLRHVGLGLVVVVVADEVLDGVVRHEVAELGGELRRERLVVREHEGRPLHLLDEPGRRRRLAGAGRAEQHDVGLPRLDAVRELLDGGRLVAARGVLADDLEGSHRARGFHALQPRQAPPTARWAAAAHTGRPGRGSSSEARDVVQVRAHAIQPSADMRPNAALGAASCAAPGSWLCRSIGSPRANRDDRRLRAIPEPPRTAARRDVEVRVGARLATEPRHRHASAPVRHRPRSRDRSAGRSSCTGHVDRRPTAAPSAIAPLSRLPRLRLARRSTPSRDAVARRLHDDASVDRLRVGGTRLGIRADECSRLGRTRHRRRHDATSAAFSASRRARAASASSASRLLDRLLERAVGVDHQVGDRETFGVGRLRVDAVRGPRRACSRAARPCARTPGLGLGVHDDDEVELVGPALVTVDQEGHVVDDHGIRIRAPGGGEQFVRALRTAGWVMALSRSRAFGSWKTIAPRAAPVERAVGRDHVGAEHPRRCARAPASRVRRPRGPPVRVDHDRAVLLRADPRPPTCPRRFRR